MLYLFLTIGFCYSTLFAPDPRKKGINLVKKIREQKKSNTAYKEMFEAFEYLKSLKNSDECEFTKLKNLETFLEKIMFHIFTSGRSRILCNQLLATAFKIGCEIELLCKSQQNSSQVDEDCGRETDDEKESDTDSTPEEYNLFLVSNLMLQQLSKKECRLIFKDSNVDKQSLERSIQVLSSSNPEEAIDKEKLERLVICACEIFGS